jgi:hypothetical protein
MKPDCRRERCQEPFLDAGQTHVWLRCGNLPPFCHLFFSFPFDQSRARSSRTPRPILRRMSVRSVTPSA